MVERDIIVEYLNNILQPSLYSDITYNGLQVEGKDKIKKIGFSVDCSFEIFNLCVTLNIDLLITHHGLIWKGWNRISGINKQRISLLIKNDINLYVSHLPLDVNKNFGNNIKILNLFNAESSDIFANVGIIGILGVEKSFDDLLNIVKNNINKNPKFINYNENKIKKIGICSGSLSLANLEEGISKNIDCIITGEAMGESMFYYIAKENKISIIFAGHYETEKFGILSLMEIIKNEFKNLEFLFIDKPIIF